jgi:hypothetical protein
MKPGTTRRMCVPTEEMQRNSGDLLLLQPSGIAAERRLVHQQQQYKQAARGL